MIHNDIQNQLQLLIKTSAPPLIEVAEHAVGSPQWTPGQQVPAHVLASLPNGRFQVQVGDQVLDLNLPRNTQPGDNLELTFVSNAPRLTFALLRDIPQPQTTPANTPVTLSETAKLIGQLLQGASGTQGAVTSQTYAGISQNPSMALQQTPVSNMTAKPVADALKTTGASVTSATPVIASPPADIPAFAQALRTSLSQSGLFYEAHQVQWLNGERQLSSLRQEPQGQLAPLQNAAHPTVSAAKAVESAPAAQSPTPIVTDKGALDAVVHPQTVPLVQQQLQALDTRQVIWQGQVWPGQVMQWEVEEDGAHHGGSQEGEAKTWHTRLNLQLPTLGGINAKLAFVDGAIQLDITADSAESAAMMGQQQQELADRFQSSGLSLMGVSIRHG